MRRKGWLIRLIREAVRTGKLRQPFRPRDLVALGVQYNTASTFPAKHAVGNHGDNSELFVRVGPGLYRLKE